MIGRRHLYTSICRVRWGFLSRVTTIAVLLSLVGNAQTFTVLYSFKEAPDGYSPLSGVIRDSAGNLYGTTYNGGANGDGTVFKIDTKGNESVLYSFAGGTDGANPVGGLVRDDAGNLYGTTDTGGNPDCGFYSCGIVYKVDEYGNETVLYRFGGLPDGHSPESNLVLDKAGSLYGTTEAGGDNGCNPGYGCGTVFKIDTGGREIILHTFTGTRELDGAFPYAGLVADAKGDLFGTTALGGAPACIPPGIPATGDLRRARRQSNTGGCGTIFKIDKARKETILHRFSVFFGGESPSSPVILDKAGNIYSATEYGGSGYSGIVFKLSKRGDETVLYNFSYSQDGEPWGGLVRDIKGNLYGTTFEGGSYYDGTVYKLDKSGRKTILHSFSGYGDGGDPGGMLVMDEAGNLYGTASNGGIQKCYDGCGVVFKITP
jgi:uncharacterized repeat protein (TIGR03803 family)